MWIVVGLLLLAGVGLPLALGWFHEALAELPWLLWPLAFLLFYEFGQPLLTARAFEKRQGTAGARLEVEVSPDGVRGRGPRGEARYLWRSLRRVVETPEFFLFYVGANAAVSLPKHAASEAELGRIRVLAHTCFSQQRGD